MKVGFTGTRNGMTKEQSVSVFRTLCEYHPTEVHHGDCVGADRDFHDISKGCKIWVVIHPPHKEDLRAFCVGDETKMERSYLARNRHIVDETEILIATPKSRSEELRSGT